MEMNEVRPGDLPVIPDSTHDVGPIFDLHLDQRSMYCTVPWYQSPSQVSRVRNKLVTRWLIRSIYGVLLVSICVHQPSNDYPCVKQALQVESQIDDPRAWI